MRAGSEIGDIAVVMPLATAIFGWLLLMRTPRRAAWWWAVAVASCVSVTAVLEVVFYGCPPAPDLHSPSGHTSLSTLIYGAIALMAATESAGWPRIVAISSGAGLIVAIAASRLLLYAHSAAEIGSGLVIGITALALFSWRYLQSRATVWLSPLFLAGGALVVVLPGTRLRR
jgi:membrane-associated phospholipid phosphatase